MFLTDNDKLYIYREHTYACGETVYAHSSRKRNFLPISKTFTSAVPYSAHTKVQIFRMHFLINLTHCFDCQACDDLYLSSKDLVAHCFLEHKGEEHSLRQPTKPFKPPMPLMPSVPQTMPAYMVVPRDVRPAPISKARHAVLGPWVRI